MACLITSGVNELCEYSVGGINRIWLANKIDIAGYVLNTDSSVQAITMQPLKLFYQFEFSNSTGLATSTIQINTGQKNFLQTVGFSIPRSEQAIINTIEDLGLSNVVAIVESRVAWPSGSTFEGENRYFVFGRLNGLKVATMNAGFGQAETDYSGFVLTLTSTETENYRELVPDSGTYTTIQAYIDTIS
jgi:hypothetical protein